MSLSADDLKKKICESLTTTHVVVNDISPGMCGASFEAVVVADEFQGKGRLQQHRLVQTILSEEMKSIHAFTLKTYTPDKWKDLEGAS